MPIADVSISGISAYLYEVRDLDVSKILLVTVSGAGAPLERLYLIPKSPLGPEEVSRHVCNGEKAKSSYLPPGL